jgi:4-hydroxy-L-threonine phosphate dehydrogenase PdxA
MIGSVELQSRKIRKRSKRVVMTLRTLFVAAVTDHISFTQVCTSILEISVKIRPLGATIIKSQRKILDIEVSVSMIPYVAWKGLCEVRVCS